MRKILYELLMCNNLKSKINIISYYVKKTRDVDFEKENNFYFLSNQASSMFR